MPALLAGSCGRCYELKCNPSTFKDGYGSPLNRTDACYDPDASVVVTIVDACPCTYPVWHLLAPLCSCRLCLRCYHCVCTCPLALPGCQEALAQAARLNLGYLLVAAGELLLQQAVSL